MITKHHIGQSVEGPLMNWTDRDWKDATKWITRPDGSRMTGPELRAEFVKLLGEGKKVIPVGTPCDGFSYETGCPGHTIPEPADVKVKVNLAAVGEPEGRGQQ